MHLEVDSRKLNQALRAVCALGSFVKESIKGDDANPCLLTAKNGLLVIEAANYGFYVKHTIKADIKEDGTFGVSASVLSKCRFAEKTSLKKSKKIKAISVTSGAFRYRIKELGTAIDLVTTGRPRKKKIRVSFMAKLAVDTFKTLIGTTSFKPGLKEESLRVQMEFSKKGKIGTITITGLDSYSFARMKATGPDIRIKKPFKAILKTTLLNNVLKELDIGNVSDDEIGSGEPIKIGMVYDLDGNSSLIRFTTNEFDIFYPVLSIPFDDVTFVLKRFSDPKSIDCSFITKRSEMQESIGAVTAIAGTESVVLNIRVSSKNVLLTANMDDNIAKTEIPARKIKGKNRGITTISVHSKYFVNFIHLAPEIVPMKIESCGKAYVRISALKLESSSIEFLVARVSQTSQQN